MKGLVTSLGAVALALTRDYKPDAVTLDIHLPDIQGWRVLDRLKNDLSTRHIPVCVISTDEARERAFSLGAFAFVSKPISDPDVLDRAVDEVQAFLERSTRNILLVGGADDWRRSLAAQLTAEDVQALEAASPDEAAELCRQLPIDCVVAGPDSDPLPDVLLGCRADLVDDDGARRLPIVVTGVREDELGDWQRVADFCTLHRAQSSERLYDAIAFASHFHITSLPDERRQLIRDVHQIDRVLAGRKVLIVDDDMRNIFALSTVLEEHQMRVVFADNGREAIQLLQQQTDIEIVLMDIMMPEMDGLETMREIRKISDLKNLPIVAVTAKAMKGDREKCIEAGAWDYLSKPVDPAQMLAVLQAWLYR